MSRPPAKRVASRVPTKTKSGGDAASSSPLRLGQDLALQAIARDVRGWTDFVLGLATSAADLSFRRAEKSESAKPAVDAARRAGDLFKDLRSAAGLNLQELSKAIDLRDNSLLKAVEEGRAGLPFGVILRLASVLGRNDPLTVVMQLTRAYNPQIWKSLDTLGVGKLMVQGAREREFANIYRASDEGRELSDEEFTAVLEFVRSGYSAAMVMRKRLVA